MKKNNDKIIYIKDNFDSGWKMRKNPLLALINLFRKRKYGLYNTPQIQTKVGSKLS